MNNIKPHGRSRKGCFIFHTLLLLLLLTTGCGNRFFDPSQVGRFDHTPAVNVILETLGVAEEIPAAWEQGEDPRAIDTVANKSDYTLMSGDIIRIYIHELLGQSMTYSDDFEVTETGKISIPNVGVLQVKGKTETQLEEMIKKVLSPDIIINPLVHVTLLQSQQRAYSIQGDGVRVPNRYPIPRYEWRLQDALALAGGASQKNVSYVYVARQVSKSERSEGISKNSGRDFQAIQSAYNLKEPVTGESLQQKRELSKYPIGKVVVSSSEMVTDRETHRYKINTQYRSGSTGRLGTRNTYQFSNMPAENTEIENRVSVEETLKRVSGQPVNTDEITHREESRGQTTIQPPAETTGDGKSHIEWIFQNDTWVPVEVESPNGTRVTQRTEVPEEIPGQGRETQAGPVEWEIRDGRWVPVQPKETVPRIPSEAETTKIGPELTWVEPPSETRLIKIPIDKLIAGDPRYNIVIKPGDSIVIPLDVAGEYYLMGNLNRTGSVEMTGGMVTLKQAIATAGNLGPLAWPKRCEIVRRVGGDREVTVRVDLEKIFNGEQPDIYIKPHDIINVGTHATSIWRAVLRNSFRATYGFGFVYDRNFAANDYYSSKPVSEWF
ncbi:MAG: polysaccharide biosynthesis/export family protein [Sedimentisphaerales bacterium]|nr:polysaccharide biosynthesis/export family protein [Sedimentisphaerales bacterium]